MGQKLPLAGLRVVDLLRDLQARHDLAYLFISHDLKVVRAMADELIVMREGRVVEQGPAARVFDHPKHPYVVRLSTYTDSREEGEADEHRSRDLQALQPGQPSFSPKRGVEGRRRRS
ncbi:MAG TPA: hypothetical protein VMN03_14265 [Burkholderiales bacterium]|nr:hypothetical protein [Burkholderiales bacterium]